MAKPKMEDLQFEAERLGIDFADKSYNELYAEVKAAKEPEQADESKSEESTDKVYFRNRKFSGQKFRLSDGSFVSFVPYYERYQGDQVKVGYMAVDASNDELVKRLHADSMSEEISEEEYNNATGEGSRKAPK